MTEGFTIRLATEDDVSAIRTINLRAWSGGITTHELLERRHGQIDGCSWVERMADAAATHLAEWLNGEVRRRTVTPEDFGLARARLADLAVSSPADSADRIKAVLGGKKGPDRDVILLNAAAALTVAGKADELPAALPLAAESVDSGAAAAALEKLIEISNAA